MSSDRFDLIVLGCGPAGEKAATQAAFFGYRVVVVERAPRPGGAMVNTGTIPSKALRETALLCSSFRRRPIPGMALEIERRMSVPRFTAQAHLIQLEEHDRIERSLDRHGIQIVRGHGRIHDPHTVVVESIDGGSRTLHGDFILIATGSSPWRPGHIPFDHPCIVDADGVLELPRLPESLAIVGAGVIGCEYACIFAEIGARVTLFEPRDRILPFLDDDCREVLMSSMAAAGVGIRLNTRVDEVRVRDAVDEVVVRSSREGTESERRTETNRYDILLWATGRSGNTRELGLERVGIECDKRGIITVDEAYRTSVQSIFAAGDVIGPPALTSTSMEQGRVAACRMFNLDFKKHVTNLFPIGLYTIPGVAMVGLSEDDAKRTGREIVVGSAPYRLNVRSRMYRDSGGLLKLVFDRRSRALLGAAMVGEQATELIHIAQPVIAAGEGMDYFINACFNYPSISDLYKYATYAALQAMSGERDSSRREIAPSRAASSL